MKNNKEEKYILDALESGKIKLISPFKKEIESIKTAANKIRRIDNPAAVLIVLKKRIFFFCFII